MIHQFTVSDSQQDYREISCLQSYHMIHHFTVSDSQQDYRERSYLLPYDPPVHSQWQPTRLQGNILSPVLPYDPPVHSQWQPTRLQGKILSPTIWSTSSQWQGSGSDMLGVCNGPTCLKVLVIAVPKEGKPRHPPTGDSPHTPSCCRKPSAWNHFLDMLGMCALLEVVWEEAA